jgi:hypothetical protein
MPDAGRTHGPPAEDKQAAVTTGSADTASIPCAMVYGLIRDLPGDRLSCPRRSRARQKRRDLCASTGAPGPHDFAVRCSVSRLRFATRLTSQRPPHYRSNVRDDAYAPHPDRNARSIRLIL